MKNSSFFASLISPSKITLFDMIIKPPVKHPIQYFITIIIKEINFKLIYSNPLEKNLQIPT